MSASQEFSKEQLNYYRICYITTDILTEGLRSLFKQEWDNRYKATLGEWKDDAKSGMAFYNEESPRNQRRNAHLLVTIRNGDRAKWDCTMLFYAILYSDCIGRSLSPTVRTNVDDLRKFRNEEFAHMPRGSLVDADFQNTISKVHGAFQALGLSTSQINDVKNQTYFPTEKLSLVEQELLQEKQQRKVLEDQLEKDISPFCILPPKPSHHVTGRNREVAEITKQLKELKWANKNELSYLYISGNPGSGKSQLAGLIAKRFFDEAREIPSSTPCVMTLNAASPDSLLESYALMARQVKCPEYAVTNTINSKDVKTEEKISNLKTLISARIELYTSWLLIVDNVFSMPWVHVHLPERGNEQWSNGQILITTQDVSSIPSTGSFVNHVSISRGMEADDSCSLLAMLSGISSCEIEKEVTMKLDYQPLALASAATYVKQVRQNKTTSNFTWVDYLEKIEKGQRSTTEKFLSQSNLCYPKSMTAATTLAVENGMISDKIVGHTFALLSLCSADPLSLDIVFNYISRVDEQAADKELICLNLKRCSLVLFEEDEGGAFIRVHQVVHDAIKTVMEDHQEPLSQIINAAAASFSQFITAIPKHCKTYSDTIHLVPHLKALINTTYDNKGTLRPDNINSDYLIQLGEICTEHCECDISWRYHKYALTTRLKILGPDHTQVANSYLHLGNIHQSLGDLKHAKEYEYLALEIYLKEFGPDHIYTARVYSGLGTIHRDLGDLELAKEYQERALAIQLKRLGPDHADVAFSCHYLGRIHHNLGDLERAKECHARAIAISLKRLGPDNVDVAANYSHLGRIHHDLGDIKVAKEYHERALAIVLKRLGPDHADVAISYHHLGRIQRDLGDLELAKEYHECALATYLKRHGPDNVDVAGCYHHLGRIQRDSGDLELAKEYHERALAIDLKTLGSDHANVASCYHHLGCIHHDLGDTELAKEYHERALAIHLKTLGPDHAEVASCYHHLGRIHHDLGDIKLAKEYHERALATYLKTLGPDHAEVAKCYHYLGRTHHDLGDLELAKEYHELAQRLGPDNVDIASSYHHLGCTHYDLGELKRAKEYHESALAIYLKRHGPDHANVASCYLHLGCIRRDLGDLERAKEYHERALAIHLKTLGSDHANVASCHHHLGCIHHDLGDIELAKEYHERALAIHLKALGPDHAEVASCYHHLGRIHHDLGDIKLAKEYHERALATYLKTLGPDHAEVAKCYHYLGRTHHDLGDLELAREYHECTLAIDLKRLGPYNVDIAFSYHHLGCTHHDLGNLKRAKEYHESALAIYLKRVGPDHANVASCYHHLGCIRRDLEDLERAKEYHESPLAIDLKTLGPDNADVAVSYHHLECTHYDLGDLECPKEYHESTLAIEKNKPAGKHNSNSGCIDQKLNDLDRAMEHQEPLNVTTTDGHSVYVHDEQVEDLRESSKHQKHSETVNFQNQAFQHSDETTDSGKLCSMCNII